MASGTLATDGRWARTPWRELHIYARPGTKPTDTTPREHGLGKKKATRRRTRELRGIHAKTLSASMLRVFTPRQTPRRYAKQAVPPCQRGFSIPRKGLSGMPEEAVTLSEKGRFLTETALNTKHYNYKNIKYDGRSHLQSIYAASRRSCPVIFFCQDFVKARLHIYARHNITATDAYGRADCTHRVADTENGDAPLPVLRLLSGSSDITSRSLPPRAMSP